MALKKKITENIRLVGAVEILEYIAVKEISGGKDKMVAEVVFTKESKDGEFIKVDQFPFVPDLFGDNFIAQAYAHLKTLPEFSGAVDC